MTRTVFDNRQVAHVWAQQTQESGRSNTGQLFFEGPTIYSYGRHFPIASFTTMPDGSRAVLFTTRRYSITTSKHQTFTACAIPRDVPIHPVYNPEWEPLHNWQHARDLAQEALKYAGETKHGGARKKRVADYAQKVQDANRLHELFAVGERLIVADDITAELARMATAEALKRAEAARKEQERNAEMLAAWPEMVAHWRAGNETWFRDRELVRYSFSEVSRIAPIALRVKPGEPETIETTWGAQFPTADALKALPFIKGCRETESEVKIPRCGPKLGHFQIDAVTAGGDVKAGCHLVPWEAIAACAADLGVAV